MQAYDYNSSARNLKKVFTFFIFYSIILVWIVGDDRMKHIYTSIDIGSDAIKIVVAELYQNKINLLASTSTASKGIKKGLIVDFDQALESVRNALNDIESMLGLKIKKAIASIPSFNAEYSIIKGDIKINNEESTVTHEDVLIDGKTAGDIGDLVLKDREMLSDSGIVIVNANIDKEKRIIINKPNILTKGFVYVKDNIDMIKEAESIVSISLIAFFTDSVASSTSVIRPFFIPFDL